MKELLGLLQEVNRLLREERDSTVHATKQMSAKLQNVSLRCEANRRRLEQLRHQVGQEAAPEG